MSEQTAEATATGAEENTQQQEQAKPTETVDFWKQKAREQEKRAKEKHTARLRIHVVMPPSRPELLHGALFGIEEAQRTAALMAAVVHGVRHEQVDDLHPRFADGVLAGIIGGHDAESVTRLARRAGGQVPVMNAGAGADELRAAHCHDAVFHVAASDAMLSHAARAAGTSGARIAPWHPSLFRYGAGQLNDRFRARFPGAAGMSGDAWCGWMAAKVLSEAALRSRATSTVELIAWMSSPRQRFDGHKGVALTFDAQRQLRQPLYALGADGQLRSEIAPAPHGGKACE
jgi:hypothetical protein